ncbi:MAG: hypothetical protein LVR00_01525 [Rhabdochlamydiaceae bacterium]
MAFSKYPSYLKLLKLAESKVDLRSALTPQRVKACLVKSLGLKLFFATERVSDEILETLCELAQDAKAVQKMAAMQAGEKVNAIQGYTSENRPALHTAMRDFFDHPQASSDAKQASALALQEIEKLQKFLPKMDHFTTLVQIGIGGSSLGPEAICDSLGAFHRQEKKLFLFLTLTLMSFLLFLKTLIFPRRV